MADRYSEHDDKRRVSRTEKRLEKREERLLRKIEKVDAKMELRRGDKRGGATPDGDHHSDRHGKQDGRHHDEKQDGDRYHRHGGGFSSRLERKSQRLWRKMEHLEDKMTHTLGPERRDKVRKDVAEKLGERMVRLNAEMTKRIGDDKLKADITRRVERLERTANRFLNGLAGTEKREPAVAPSTTTNGSTLASTPCVPDTTPSAPTAAELAYPLTQEQREQEEKDYQLALALDACKTEEEVAKILETEIQQAFQDEDEELMKALEKAKLGDPEEEEQKEQPSTSADVLDPVPPPPPPRTKSKESAASSMVSKDESAEESINQVDLTCDICLDRKKNIVFVPCGHIVSCDQCWDDICQKKEEKQCPMCRSEVTSTLRTFL